MTKHVCAVLAMSVFLVSGAAGVAGAQDAPPPPASGTAGPPAPMGRMPYHGKQGGGPQDHGAMPQDHGPQMHGHEGGMGAMGGRLIPPGTWWRNADVVSRVGISADQVKHIDEIFLQSRVKLIDLHASLEKEQLMLEPLLNANPVDTKKAQAEIGKIADERAELEKTDAGMLLSIRGVLTAEQWTKLQAEHGGMRRGGPEGRGPGGPGRPAGGRGGMPTPPADDQL